MGVEGMQRICPICGKDNNCQHGQGGCWCDTEKFPEEIFSLIPVERKGKACICRDCVQKFRREGAAGFSNKEF